MKIFSASIKVLTFALFITALSTVAQAQATRTWVSALGDDVNPCSRTAPCKTYAGAYSKTAPGGEISVLDPGGYGTLNIGHSLTLDGGTGAGWGSTMAGATQSAITVNAGASDIVRLRNLTIDGMGNPTYGVDGIRYLAGATLHIENVHIFNFTGDGIEVAFPAGMTAGRLNARNVVISECGGTGILVGGANSMAHAITVEESNITRCGNGVRVSNRAVITLRNSVVSYHNAAMGSAAIMTDTVAGAGAAIINVENCQVDYNSVAIQPNANQAIRLSNTSITGNGFALNFNGGTIASFKNNKIVGNAAGEGFASLTPVDPK